MYIMFRILDTGGRNDEKKFLGCLNCMYYICRMYSVSVYGLYVFRKVIYRRSCCENVRFGLKVYERLRAGGCSLPEADPFAIHYGPSFYGDGFLCFDSKMDAMEAFEKSSDRFSDLEEEGSDYKKGWLAGVCDASIEQYVYVSNNLIIAVDTKCYSEWASVDGAIEQEPDLDAWRWKDSYRQEVIDLMRNTF